MSSLLISGLALGVAVVAVLSVSGTYVAQRDMYPSITIMRNITLSTVFERMEPIIASVWIFSIFIKITVAFLVALLGLAHLQGTAGGGRGQTGAKAGAEGGTGTSFARRSGTYTHYILPTAILIWSLSNQLHPNRSNFMEMTIKDWTPYTFSYYLLVMAVLIWGIVFKKNKSSGGTT